MPNNRLKLCMLSGSFEYDSEASLAVFQDYIEKNCPVQATQIIYRDEDDDQSLESLQDADVLLVFHAAAQYHRQTTRSFQSVLCRRQTHRRRTDSKSRLSELAYL